MIVVLNEDEIYDSIINTAKAKASIPIKDGEYKVHVTIERNPVRAYVELEKQEPQNP